MNTLKTKLIPFTNSSKHHSRGKNQDTCNEELKLLGTYLAKLAEATCPIEAGDFFHEYQKDLRELKRHIC